MGLRETLGARSFGVAEEVEIVPAELSDDFDLDDQLRENWCWAAVSISVALHQKKEPTRDQCAVVEDVTHCGECQSDECDTTGDIAEALELLKVPATAGEKAPDFTLVHTALLENRPVICTVRREPSLISATHAIVLRSANLEERAIEVRDPTNPKHGVKYWEEFTFWDDFQDNIVEHYIVQAEP